MPTKFPRLLRLPEVLDIVGLRSTQLKEAIKRGEFPKPIKLTDSGRAVAWSEEEILAWRQARFAQRDAEVA